MPARSHNRGGGGITPSQLNNVAATVLFQQCSSTPLRISKAYSSHFDFWHKYYVFMNLSLSIRTSLFPTFLLNLFLYSVFFFPIHTCMPDLLLLLNSKFLDG